MGGPWQSSSRRRGARPGAGGRSRRSSSSIGSGRSRAPPGGCTRTTSSRASTPSTALTQQSISMGARPRGGPGRGGGAHGQVAVQVEAAARALVVADGLRTQPAGGHAPDALLAVGAEAVAPRCVGRVEAAVDAQPAVAGAVAAAPAAARVGLRRRERLPLPIHVPHVRRGRRRRRRAQRLSLRRLHRGVDGPSRLRRPGRQRARGRAHGLRVARLRGGPRGLALARAAAPEPAVRPDRAPHHGAPGVVRLLPLPEAPPAEEAAPAALEVDRRPRRRADVSVRRRARRRREPAARRRREPAARRRGRHSTGTSALRADERRRVLHPVLYPRSSQRLLPKV